MREYIRHITTPSGEILVGVVMGESHKDNMDTYGIYANHTVFTYKELNHKPIMFRIDIKNIIFSRFDRMLNRTKNGRKEKLL